MLNSLIPFEKITYINLRKKIAKPVEIPYIVTLHNPRESPVARLNLKEQRCIPSYGQFARIKKKN